ncbi:MAG: hypothetical protein WC845_01445 [Candidatus Staskawiczbacteria bacterium]|jgi:hypothetical protein
MTTHAIVRAIPLSKLASLRMPRINWKLFLVFSFCSVLLLSVFYVIQINSMIRGGYLIKDYQKQIDKLLAENKNLEVDLAQISYLENIQAKTAEMNFEKIQTIKYIQILDNSLATR